MSKLQDAKTAYTFDDFVLVPVYSEIRSRKDPNISTNIKDKQYSIPIVSAPMNTVTEEQMLFAMASMGGIGVLHRYMTTDQQINIYNKVIKDLEKLCVEDPQKNIYVSVGAGTSDVSEDRVNKLVDAGVRNFCVDVANGHSVHCVDALKNIKNRLPESNVMAGNVCSFDGAYKLAENGAGSIRCGIGPGCFRAGTRVLMANGSYKNIENIRSGDRVINCDGEAKEVIWSGVTGRKKTYKHKGSLFYLSTYCTKDHKYLVNSGNQVVWKQISDVSQEDSILMPKKINFEIKNTFFEKVGITPTHEIGYIIGFMLANGMVDKIMNNFKCKLHLNRCTFAASNVTEILLHDNRDYLCGLFWGMKNSNILLNNVSREVVELYEVLKYMVDDKNELETNKYIYGNICDSSSDPIECDVYDIQVDCPTHSFIANNAIVHNSMCTTRMVTGHGVPQLSAIEECCEIKEKFPDVAIIADGGIKKSADIIKALAIGADFVMIGALLAGTTETPGDYIEENGVVYKYYHGMASLEGRKSWFDCSRLGLPSEGVSKKIQYLGRSAKEVVEGLCQSLRVGLSYAGSNNLQELRKNAQWRKVTSSGYVEGTPHGKNN